MEQLMNENYQGSSLVHHLLHHLIQIIPLTKSKWVSKAILSLI